MRSSAASCRRVVWLPRKQRPRQVDLFQRRPAPQHERSGFAVELDDLTRVPPCLVERLVADRELVFLGRVREAVQLRLLVRHRPAVGLHEPDRLRVLDELLG
jgi:hypothetical protein